MSSRNIKLGKLVIHVIATTHANNMGGKGQEIATLFNDLNTRDG